ncbi:MAG: DUF2155 domain-containing protein [Rhodobacteraceae bacterium]|nr:DUF2155 domain-containing protein [Paracoccaceae bacterium]
MKKVSQIIRHGIVLCWFGLSVSAQGIAPEYRDEPDSDFQAQTGRSAIIRSLDSIAGKTEDFEIATGQSLNTDRFSITLHDCRYLPENPQLHSFAFVEIKQISDNTEIFNAWLISQLPALSAVEHPRYDFWLIRCTTSEPEEASGSEVN